MSSTTSAEIFSRSGGPNGPSGSSTPPAASSLPTDQTIPPRPTRRRTFTVNQKLNILTEYETGDPLTRGALLRREGIYTSTISAWRQARDHAAKTGLSTIRRGPRPASTETKRITQLEAENNKLKRELATAEKVIRIQGELAALLEELSTNSATPPPDSKAGQ